MKKINSLQLLGTVIENYSMESLFDYYIDIQIQREKDHLRHVCLYETERPLLDNDDGYDTVVDWDDDGYEFWTEEDLRIQHGFEE